MKYVKGQITRRKKPKISPAEQSIIDAPIPSLIKEFKLIQEKQCKLSSHLRDVVIMRVKFLVKGGFIKSTEDLLLCSHPFFDFNKRPLMKDCDCLKCEFVIDEFTKPIQNIKN